MFSRLSILSLLYVLLVTTAIAQKQNNNWYFGNGAAISFSTGVPAPFLGSAQVSIEGCASVSDKLTGAILFYSDGLTIWNRNNNAMLNGTGLMGGMNTSASQGVVVVPYPGSDTRYFVFTTDETFGGAVNGFRYSVVDMALDGGLGGVVSDEKNILIQTGSTERIAVVPTSDDSGFWVMIHERGNNLFKAYKLTASGIAATPVVSAVGSVHSTAAAAFGDGTMGCMKVNSSNDRLAVAIYAQNKVEVFDFDNCTGTLSNATAISTTNNPYGIEFSPDGSKLYYSMYDNATFSGLICQVDLSSASLVPIAVGLSSSFNNQCVGALQLAPDNKIYAVINSESWLSAIDNPDQAGVACNFIDKAILLPLDGVFPRPGLLGLPVKVPALAAGGTLPVIVSGDSCLNGEISFTLNAGNSSGNVTWTFADGSDTRIAGISETVGHAYNAAGTYKVTAAVAHTCGIDTISKTINVVNCDTLRPNCGIRLPDAFTPNGDGLNDDVHPVIQCPLSKYDFYIYNRWGELVFHSADPAARWNGRYKEKDCELGVYNYFIQYYADKQHFYTGTITLVR